MTRIAIDAMGGDDAPGVVVRGAYRAAQAHPQWVMLLVGDEGAVRRELATCGAELPNIAIVLRLTRSSMLEVVGQEYVKVARAKGLAERTVLFKHALRNALLPVVTVVTLGLPTLIAGAVLTEIVFGWPGLGRLTFDAIHARDYPLLMGMFIFISIVVIVANLIADLLYALLDPRIRYQ